MQDQICGAMQDHGGQDDIRRADNTRGLVRYDAIKSGRIGRGSNKVRCMPR